MALTRSKTQIEFSSLLQSTEFGDFLKNVIETSVSAIVNPLIEKIDELRKEIEELKLEQSNVILGNNKLVNNTKTSPKQVHQTVELNVNKTINESLSSPTVDYARAAGSKTKQNKKIVKENSVTSALKVNESVSDVKDDENDGFVMVRRKKNRIAIIRGNDTSENEFSCVASKVWVFLGRCHTETQVTDINSYLNKKYPDRQFIIEDLNSKGLYKSFKIGADMDLIEDLYNPSNWPQGALVKRFFLRKTEPAGFKN